MGGPKERSSSERNSPRQRCCRSLATKAKSLPQCNITRIQEQLQFNQQKEYSKCLANLNLKNCTPVMKWQTISKQISNAATVPSSTSKLFNADAQCRCRSRTTKDVILETTCWWPKCFQWASRTVLWNVGLREITERLQGLYIQDISPSDFFSFISKYLSSVVEVFHELYNIINLI